jgi:hypothetical protein
LKHADENPDCIGPIRRTSDTDILGDFGYSQTPVQQRPPEAHLVFHRIDTPLYRSDSLYPHRAKADVSPGGSGKGQHARKRFSVRRRVMFAGEPPG